MLEGLYEIYGVGALMIVGCSYVWRDKQSTIKELHERITELEKLNLELINKSTSSIEWFKEYIEKLTK